MIGLKAIVTAGVAVALLAPATSALAADGPGDASSGVEAAMGAYQRAFPKISPDAAKLAASQQDQRKSLYDTLAKDPAAFGGAWFDPPTGILHIAVTDASSGKRALELGRGQGLDVQPQLVKYSYDALLRTAAALRSPDSAIGKAANGNVGIDPQTNAVVASVPPSLVEELAKQAPDNVRIAADPGIKSSEDQCTSRAFCDTTIHAGDMIWTGSKGNNVCSVGFTARDASNTRYTYTAGHCSGGNGITWGTGNQTIGPMQSSINTSFLDASIIRVSNGWFTGDTGGEIYNEVFPNRTVNVNGVAPTLSYIWQGDVVCLAANYTQPNGLNYCGVIGSAMDWGNRGLARVDGFDGCHGDSGGGWYWLTNSGRRIAYGLHSRSSDGCHGDQGGSTSWFSALPLVKAFFTPTLNVELRP